jgi:hypothetical protein
MAAISGHGATLGFTTESGFTPGYISIGGFEATREALDTSTLATTGARTKIGGDLFDVGSFTAPFFFDPAETATSDDNCLDDIMFDSGSVHAVDTTTVTFPDAGACTMAAGAYVIGAAIEELATDTLIRASITVQWADWPTLTE